MGFLSLLVVIELVIVKDGFLVGFRVRVLGRVQGVISDSEGLQRSIFFFEFLLERLCDYCLSKRWLQFSREVLFPY